MSKESPKHSQNEVEFNLLMKIRPNIYGNTLVISVLKTAAWLLSIWFLIAGVVFSVSTYFDSFVEEFHSTSEVTNDSVKAILALSCYLLCIAFTLSVWFGRMLVRRNAFLMEIDQWHKKQLKKNNHNAEQS